jgi:hypothetical protein
MAPREARRGGRVNILGLRITRRVLVLALVAFVLLRLARRGRGGGFPNFTLRQRAEP